MKTFKEYTNKNELNEKKYNKKEMKKIIDKAFIKLWDGFNDLEVISTNYLKSVGQGGLVDSFHTEIDLLGLKDAIEKADENVPKSFG